MRVVLVRPLTRPPSYDPEVQEPLGIESLAAFLRREGHEVLLCDALLSGSTDRTLARRIAGFGPRLVGVSLMSDADIESADTLVREIARLASSAIAFVVGGSLVSTEPERVASLLPGDTLLIRFEGEIPLLKLVRALERATPLHGVPALMWREQGHWQASAAFELVEDLDGLPWPARDQLEAVVGRSGVVNVQGSRGCAGSCAYCCMPGMPRPTRQAWRGRSPEGIAAELAALNQEHGIVAFNFVDDDLLGPPGHAEERAVALADAIMARKLRCGFGAQLRPVSLTPRAVDALCRAGLAWAFVGVENDDPCTLRGWRRPLTSERAWRQIDRLRQRGVEVALGTILFHPGATVDSIVRFAKSLAARGQLNYRTATSRLHLLPGSHLYNERLRLTDGRRQAGGPLTPPIADPRARKLFDLVSRSLAALRPAWVQAASLLPTYVSHQRASRPVAAKLEVVRAVLRTLDGWAGEVLLTLAADQQREAARARWAHRARDVSRRLALEAAERLATAGLVSDPGQLRMAVEIEGDV